MSIPTKIAESAARKRTGYRSFKAAYKEAPGPTMGRYIGEHKAGLAIQGGLTGIAFMPTPHHRQSSHSGIDRK